MPTPAAPTADAKSRARAVLKRDSAFASCPDAVIDDILRRGHVQRFARGETVCRQGDPGDSLMIVLSGSLKVTNVTTEARDVVLGFMKPGALLGEVAALDGRERTASVVTLEPVEVVTIYRRDLLPILRQSPESMLALLEGVCARLRSTINLVESYALETEARVASCLVRLLDEYGAKADGGTAIDLKLTQRDLGSHLGLTRETVSRTLGEFREQGLLEIRGTAIVVLDPAGLKSIAEGV